MKVRVALTTPTISLFLFLLALPVHADPPSQPPPSEQAPAAPRRFMIHLNQGMNLYTYLGPTQTDTEKHFNPTNRLILLQQLGAGYWVLPNLRLQFTLQFIETVTGLPSGASPFTFFGFIPWAVYTNGPFFAGAGAMIGVRSYGEWEPDLGIFLGTGAGFPIGGGFVWGAPCRAR